MALNNDDLHYISSIFGSSTMIIVGRIGFIFFVKEIAPQGGALMQVLFN